VSLAAESGPTALNQQKETTVQNSVARVNGIEITAAQLDRAVKSLIATQPGSNLSPETLKKVKINVLNELISTELLYQAGLKLEIKNLDKLVSDKIAQVKAKFTSEAFFNKSLSYSGLDEKTFIENARHEIIIANFLSSTIESKITVSEEESKKVYEQNIDKLTQPEQIRISQILIKADATMSVDEKKKARNTAEEIRNKLLAGASFVDLAKQYSSSPSRETGGDLGYLTREQLPPPLARAAFALKPGQLSEIVESRAGFDIIKVRDRRDAIITPYSEAKNQIEDFLKDLKKETAIREFLEKARKDAQVEVLLK